MSEVTEGVDPLVAKVDLSHQSLPKLHKCMQMCLSKRIFDICSRGFYAEVTEGVDPLVAKVGLSDQSLPKLHKRNTAS